MLNQPTRDLAYAAGSMSIHGRTIVFDYIAGGGSVTIGIIVDEEVLASDIARFVAGPALLAGDHADPAELAATRSHPDPVGAEAFPDRDPRRSTALVARHATPAVPFDLLRTPAQRAAARFQQLPARPRRAAIEYREGTVAHHGGQYVAPGRRVVSGSWRYASPEVCADDRRTGVWIGPPDRQAEQVLVCVSCGLDGT